MSTIRKAQAGVEDIALDTNRNNESFTRVGSNGQPVTLRKLNSGLIPVPNTLQYRNFTVIDDYLRLLLELNETIENIKAGGGTATAQGNLKVDYVTVTNDTAILSADPTGDVAVFADGGPAQLEPDDFVVTDSTIVFNSGLFDDGEVAICIYTINQTSDDNSVAYSLAGILANGDTTGGHNITISSGDTIMELSGNGILYPTTDGADGQVMYTNGASQLSFKYVSELYNTITDKTGAVYSPDVTECGHSVYIDDNGLNFIPRVEGLQMVIRNETANPAPVSFTGVSLINGAGNQIPAFGTIAIEFKTSAEVWIDGEMNNV